MAVQISGNDITVPRDGSFTRNVTIGGTLTYEDVTNIDSVGLVTARNGIEIGARPGVAASISVDGNMIVSGISTFGGAANFAAISGTTGTFSAAVSGTTGTFTGDVDIADKIVHTGDTNTAIRFPSADTVTVETGGSERARVDSSGRLLLGAGAIATPKSSGAGGLDLDNGSISLVIGGNENSTGRTDGTSKINRIAAPHRTNSEEPVAMLSCQASTSTNTLFYGGGSSYTNAVTEHKFYTAADATTTTGTQRLTITSAGNLGLGYNSPSQRLVVHAGSDNSDVAVFTGGDVARGLKITTSAASGPVNDGVVTLNAQTSSVGEIAFATHGTERVRIDNAGKVRFAVTNAQIELQTSDGSDNGFLNLSGGGACSQGRGAQVVCYGNEYTDYQGTLMLLAGQSGSTNGVVAFYTSGAEKLRIASDGVITNTLSADNTTAVTLRNNGTTGGHVLKVTTGGTGAGTHTFSVFRNNQSSETEVFRIDGTGDKFMDATFDKTASNERKSYFTTTGQLIMGRNAHESYLVLQDVSNNTIGSITRGAGSSVAYNTSSDYRLKENVTAISDGITRLKTLKPSRFNFISEPGKTVDGFLAHEVTAVPEAIEGEKDAVITQAMLDAGTLEGTVGDPIYQGIDQSKLVPLLTAALQEAVTEIESLKSRLDAAGL